MRPAVEWLDPGVLPWRVQTMKTESALFNQHQLCVGMPEIGPAVAAHVPLISLMRAGRSRHRQHRRASASMKRSSTQRNRPGI
jgi:hypothetical protein